MKLCQWWLFSWMHRWYTSDHEAHIRMCKVCFTRERRVLVGHKGRPPQVTWVKLK